MIGSIHSLRSCVYDSSGTVYQMPPASVDVFEGLVLDGQARMSRGSTWDWQVHGRGISRSPGLLRFRFDTGQMKRFGASLSQTRGAEWQALAHRIDADDASDSAALVGNTWFFDSDYVAHNRPGCLLQYILEHESATYPELGLNYTYILPGVGTCFPCICSRVAQFLHRASMKRESLTDTWLMVPRHSTRLVSVFPTNNF